MTKAKKLLNRLAAPTTRGKNLRDRVARTEGMVAGAFYSQAHSAWRVEFTIERDKQWYTSSFYCQHQEDAERLASEAINGYMTVEQWCELYTLAMRIAAKSNGFLYRVMLNGVSETFREKPKAIYPGGYVQ